MKVNTDKKLIEEIFARGTVVEVLPTREELVKKMTSGERIKVYIGFDPTSTALHLGHAKNIMFAEELRQLGHEVVILFGDFTAQIGDPSDKGAVRKQLTPDEIKKNSADWLRQIKPIIKLDDKENPATIAYNSTWLSKLSFADVVELASNFTVQQMLERDMFQKRLKANTPIHLHEFLYPLMQGYDSVAMNVDAEICGTDQTFNALAGRTLLKRLKNKDKSVIALNLIANPKTGELMSKSNGTGVFIDQNPNDLFGAVMALPDPMIEPLYINCTRLPLKEKASFLSQNPRDAKAKLAFEIVKIFHGEKSAVSAEESFNKTFSKGGVPEDIQEIKMGKNENLAETLIKAGIIESKTEWRRLVTDGAVKTDDDKITDPNFQPKESVVLKIGKRRFVKVVL